MSNVKTYIEIKIIDKDGKVVKEVKSEANSFVRNFIRALYGLMVWPIIWDNATTLVDTQGRTFGWVTVQDYLTSPMDILAGDGDTRYGILIGSGSDPVSYNDYRIKYPIYVHPSAGYIGYGNVEASLETLPDGKEAIVIRRTFENRAIFDITIREVGLVFYTYSDNDHRYVLIDRTVLSSPITLYPNQSALIKYIITA